MEDPVPHLRAIPTFFSGITYRSRLEARWAVFFDALSIPFNYEPEGFDLGGGLWYLPDFWLPNQKCFFEVKGPFTENKGPEKARALSIASGLPVFMFGDIPSFDAVDFGYATDGGSAFYPGGEDTGYYWCVSPCCKVFGIHYRGIANRMRCCSNNKGYKGLYTQDHLMLMMAYAAARSRDFGRGK
jgi:hypothetical protein